MQQNSFSLKHDTKYAAAGTAGTVCFSFQFIKILLLKNLLSLPSGSVLWLLKSV